MRTPLRFAVLVLSTVVTALAVTVPAEAATPYCGITWGSLPESAGTLDPTAASITDVRAGQHACYDRLVVDLGNAPGWTSYRVGYGAVLGEGSGAPVPVAGGAALQITLRAHGESFATDPRQVTDVTGYRTFRQVVSGGSFEGVTVYGLGVRARLPFRVFTLAGPAAHETRLVIDVAHRW
jgi:hypothetical protein